MTADIIGSSLVGYATLVAAIWSATEVLPRAIPALARLRKELLALILGVVLGPAAQAVGLVGAANSGWRGYAGAALLGVLGTIIAGAAHDYVAKPLGRGKV